jgi:putative SOS response-associated peptidase YedK
MCGRVVQSSPVEVIRAEFRARTDVPADSPPRYNVAPEQPVLAVTEGDQGRALRWLRWGLVPFYAKERKRGPRSINARAETVATKPAFRELLLRRRCIIPADGFYEWQGAGPARTPHFIRARDGRPLALAGLWDRWRRADEPAVETFTILTCEPNELLREIHDRMPVILPSDAVDRWLDPGLAEATPLVEMLRPAAAALLEAWPVSRTVNSPRNDGPELLARVDPPPIQPPRQATLPFGEKTRG